MAQRQQAAALRVNMEDVKTAINASQACVVRGKLAGNFSAAKECFDVAANLRFIGLTQGNGAHHLAIVGVGQLSDNCLACRSPTCNRLQCYR